MQPIHSNLQQLTFFESHPKSSTLFSKKIYHQCCWPSNFFGGKFPLAPPNEASNGYQSPPSLPSVFPLPQLCSKVFLLRSFHWLLSVPTRWAFFDVDDPTEISTTRSRNFAAIPRETIWPFSGHKGMMFKGPTWKRKSKSLKCLALLNPVVLALTNKKCMKGKCIKRMAFAGY